MTYSTIASHAGGNLWPSDWGTSGTLGIFCSRDFVADDGQSFQAGDGTSLTGQFVTSTTITVASSIPTYGSFILPKTDVATPIDVRYTGVIFDANGVAKDFLFSGFDLVTSLGNSISFLTWWNDNAQNRRYPYDTVPTTTQMNTAINAALANAALNQDYVVGNYASLSAAIDAMPASGATLVINQATSITSNKTVPAYVTFRRTGKGTITISNSVTLTILGEFQSPNTKAFYNALAGQGTVSFAGNKVQRDLYLAWWGSVSDGSTLDTTAWDAAMAAAKTMKVATIKFNAGESMVSSISSSAYSSAGNEGIHITIEGLGAPPTEAGSFPGTLAVSTRASIIKSATAGTAGVLTQAGTPYQTVSLTLKNLIVRREDNPTGPGVDWQNGFGVYLENVIIDTGRYTTDCVQPTHPAAIGVIMPGASNANTQSIRGDCFIQGFYSGLSAGEHTTQTGHLVISACAEGLLLPAGPQIHPVTFEHLTLFNNTTNIRGEGTANLNIELLAIEHAIVFAGVPAWQITVWDIDNANNDVRGFIRYTMHEAFGAFGSGTFLRNGGFFIATREMRYEKQWDVFISNSANISIPDNVDTPVGFNTTDENTALAAIGTGIFSGRINPTQYGSLNLIAQMRFASNATGIRAVRIWKHDGLDATDKLVNIEQVAALGGGLQTPVTCKAEVVASHPDDYFFVSLLQNSGGALNSVATVSPDVSAPRFTMKY